MKKLLSLAVAAVMVLSCTAMAFAAENGEPTKSPAGKAGAFFREVVVLTPEELGEHYLNEEQARALMQTILQEQAQALMQTVMQEQAKAGEEPVMLTTLTQSATGKDDGFEFDEIVVLGEEDIMPLSAIYNHTLNPRTLYILSEQITAKRVTLSVKYDPSYFTMFFGVATSSDPDTAWYYSNDATGGYGSAVFLNQQPGTYFPYVGNPTDEVITVNFSCVPS